MKKLTYLALFALVAGAALLTGYVAWGQQWSCPPVVASQQPQAPICLPTPAYGPQQASCPAQGVGYAPCPSAVVAPMPVARFCPPPVAGNAKLVEELRSLLQETNSADTFQLTAMALAHLGPDAKSAVPAIIRGAERLGLIKDLEKQMKEEEGPGLLVIDCLDQILAGPGCAPQCCSGVFAVPPTACVPATPMYAVPPCPPQAPVGAPWVPVHGRPLHPVEPTSSVELIPPPTAR